MTTYKRTLLIKKLSHDGQNTNQKLISKDSLSINIYDYYEQITQTEKTLIRKLRLRDMLYYSMVSIHIIV